MSDLRQRLAELPIERLVSLISGGGFWTSEANTDLGIPSFVLTDGPHGLRRQPADADHLGIGDSVPATCFPTASNLASSWDPAVLTEVGAALGRESRANGVGVLLGPGLNIKRHPGCGRSFEYFSEDPLLSG
ncbi:MAG: glycoside hydrolase family 3 N-terminal domain-containing protein, partial [Ilumatobacter sp.]